MPWLFIPQATNAQPKGAPFPDRNTLRHSNDFAARKNREHREKSPGDQQDHHRQQLGPPQRYQEDDDLINRA